VSIGYSRHRDLDDPSQTLAEADAALYAAKARGRTVVMTSTRRSASAPDRRSTACAMLAAWTTPPTRMRCCVASRCPAR
jgi:hypothetical protein